MIIAAVSVWTAEALNTAFEFLCDVASPEFHPLGGKAKDVSAGAVLICIIGASAIGFIILGPSLYDSSDIKKRYSCRQQPPPLLQQPIANGPEPTAINARHAIMIR